MHLSWEGVPDNRREHRLVTTLNACFPLTFRVIGSFLISGFSSAIVAREGESRTAAKGNLSEEIHRLQCSAYR